MLSDLLDCAPLSASGPELNLFSNTRLYDFPRYRANPWRCGASASAYAARDCIYRGELPAYGLDAAGHERLVAASPDFPSFVQAFAGRYLALRGKPENATVFEKTPTNINAIAQFLDACPDGWFINVVRNPVHVYASLLKRGLPPYIALITWLVDVAQYLPWRNHPRVALVRYEELVRDPYGTVSGILDRVCGATGLEEDAFMGAYRDNAYTRIYSGRVDTWSIQKTGEVRDANRKAVAPDILGRFAAGLDLSVNPAYARLFGFAPVGMREAIAATGYADEVSQLTAGIRPDVAALAPEGSSHRMLAKKALYAALTGLPDRLRWDAMLRPVVRA